MTSTGEPGSTAPGISLIGESHLRAHLETNGETGCLWNNAPVFTPDEGSVTR